MIDETETQLTEADFDEVDREALNRALRMTLDGEDRETAARIRSTLDEEGWFSAAESAAHSQQYISLGLTPWLRPPCELNESGDPHRQNRECDNAPIKLLKRMLSHGLSKWEPDPINALNNAKKRK